LFSATDANPSAEPWGYPRAVGGSDLSASSGNWGRDDAYERRSQNLRSASAYAYTDDNYYCRTAREIREVCDGGARNLERYEFCLSFAGYYTNSRHCGYRP
jgi:hypothetical protein